MMRRVRGTHPTLAGTLMRMIEKCKKTPLTVVAMAPIEFIMSEGLQ